MNLRFLVIYLFLSRSLFAQNKLKVNDTIPGFHSIYVDGKSFYSDSLKANFILIDFWASWCSPCLENNEELIDVYQKYHPKGFEIIAVGLDSKLDLLKNTIQKFSYPWRIQLWEIKEFESQLAIDFEVEALPKSYLVDSNWKIIMVNPDLYDLEKMLKRIFK